mmetsp:Transcript_15013/g.25046  ORF Transcript_15013/g.25046 Transcript_15013/m.25046 type:complete len:386 (+) Transcript_15013:2596-3753(+)
MATIESLSLATAEDVYKEVSSQMKSVLHGGENTNNSIAATINVIELCRHKLEQEALISKNESIEDIATGSLKFLFLEFYKGKCYASLQTLEERYSNLLLAKESFCSYLELCSKLNLLHETEQEARSSSSNRMSAEEKRLYKIEKFKRDKAARNRMNDLQRLVYIGRKDNDNDIDVEDHLREFYITQLQCYAREGLDEIDGIRQELPMLKMMEERRQQHEQQQGGGSNTSDTRVFQRENASTCTSTLPSSSTTPGAVPAVDRVGGSPPPQGQGISVTRTFKVGDQLMFSRDTVKATVFGDRIAPPTMSLAEFGDAQRAEAEMRAQQQAQAEADGAAVAGRRYKQLVEDGDEDDEDLVDKAVMKDRDWDDWKDENPRGWGNKMGKRF